jgi:hypothetical protein
MVLVPRPDWPDPRQNPFTHARKERERKERDMEREERREERRETERLNLHPPDRTH